MFKKVLVSFAITAITALATMAFAQGNVTYSYNYGSGTYSQTATIGAYQPNNSEYDLSFNAFDDGGGIRALTSVAVETTLSTWGGSFGVQNLSGSSSSPATVKFGVDGSISSSDVSLKGLTTSSQFIIAYTTGTSPILSPYGQPGDTYTVNGPASSNPKIYDTGMQTVSGSLNTQGYTISNLGSPTFVIAYNSTGYEKYSGGNLQQEINPMYANGSVTVVYNYTGVPFPVPEPATIGLFLIGGLALMLRKRN